MLNFLKKSLEQLRILIIAQKSSAVITREPKQDLNVTKSQLLRLKVGFGHLSVTLSNAGGAQKCVGKHYTLLMVIHIDYGLEVVIGNNQLRRRSHVRIVLGRPTIPLDSSRIAI
jgi:hypothetical protein